MADSPIPPELLAEAARVSGQPDPVAPWLATFAPELFRLARKIAGTGHRRDCAAELPDRERAIAGDIAGNCTCGFWEAEDLVLRIEDRRPRPPGRLTEILEDQHPEPEPPADWNWVVHPRDDYGQLSVGPDAPTTAYIVVMVHGDDVEAAKVIAQAGRMGRVLRNIEYADWPHAGGAARDVLAPLEGIDFDGIRPS